jgi:hypothetical protein
MLVDLHNDFHNTWVRVRVSGCPATLSAHQTRRVDRALCGMSDCLCGTMRGEQHWPDGRSLYVELALIGDVTCYRLVDTPD